MLLAPSHRRGGLFTTRIGRSATGAACMWNFGRDPFEAFQFFALQLPCMILGALLGTLGAVAILQVLGV